MAAKPIEEFLKHLARPEVIEFGLVTNRLPSVNIGGKFEAVDDTAPNSDEVLTMLYAAGGSRYVETLGEKPVQWTTRVEGVGVVAVAAVIRNSVVQARFTVAKRAGIPPQGSAQAAPAPNPLFVQTPAVAIVPGLVPTRLGQEGGAVRQAAAAPAAAPAPAAARAPARAPAGAPAAAPAPTPAAPPASTRDVAPASTREPSAPESNSFRLRADAPLAWYLAAATNAHASDLHIIAGRPLLLRIATDLVPQTEPMAAEHVERLCLEMVPERLRPALDRDGACDFALEHPQHGRFRVNVSRQRTGYKASMRVIPREMPTLASLGLPQDVAKAADHHQGLVLVTGPTGHGKTSTLAAIVDLINAGGPEHILTVEDPIEYVHTRKKAMISQREVGSHTKTFFAALKASLREDPDVIVIGELRDAETVRMAVSASETGHLVLGTMNTPSAAKTVDRLIDLFPPAEQAQVRTSVAGALRLIIGQRLVPSADRKSLHAAVELLPSSIALYTLIRDGKTFRIPSLQQRGRAMGVYRLDESLIELVRAKKVTVESAKAVAESPQEFEAALQRAAAPPAAAAPPPQAKKG